VLSLLIKYVKSTSKLQDLSAVFQKLLFFGDELYLAKLANYALFRSVQILPAVIRAWWTDDCRKGNKPKLSKFIANHVRASLISREMKLIKLASAGGVWNTDEMTVTGSVLSGEVIATLNHEDAKVELKIKIPTDYPLKNVEVECLTRLGVPEGKWRRWILQIVSLLSLQDGTYPAHR
jgi:hypothetical protein